MIPETTSGQKTPIALFVYNRPSHAWLTLDTLSRCHRLDECSLRIYCDGAKTPDDFNKVAAARRVAHEWGKQLGAEVVEREANWGLARSIVTGVTELCDRFGRVIVLEDDFALSPDFLDYMLQGLDRYADNANVYQISGYMHPVRHTSREDAFFLPLITTWGWATWSRAWQIFDSNAGGAESILSDPELRRQFDLNGNYPYANMLQDRLKGKNDSWGILFWLAVFRAKGLALHPRKSLVWNGGFDQSGVHCGNRAWSNNSFSKIVERKRSKPFLMPAKVVSDETAFSRVLQFLKSEQASGTLLERIRRRVLQRLRSNEMQRIHLRYSQLSSR
jgi:hypothetical protein